MIIEVELVDFLSHGTTSVKFGPGMNVIVGPNGAGKSSIVDAITFAFFGKHTRKVNKLLIRHGATSGYATVIFEVGDRRFMATRKLKTGGAATPTLYEWSDKTWVNVAAGERRQMDESTTRVIEDIVGMDFEKMQIASIIRQGELADIVRESPKEFKTRINDIIGNSDLDVADGMMADLLAGFRNSIRDRLGHDDLHLPTITAELEDDRAESQKAGAEMRALAAERAEAEAGIKALEDEASRAEEGARARGELEARSAELAKYASEAGREAAADRDRIAGEAAECRRRLGECEAGGGGGADAMRSRAAAIEAELARAEEGSRARGELEARGAELAKYASEAGREAAGDRDRIAGEAAECRRRLGECEAGGGGGADAMRSRAAAVEAELTRAEEGARASGELDVRRKELAGHAKQRGREAAADRDRIAGVAAECRSLLDVARTAGEVATRLEEARHELEAEAELVTSDEKKTAALEEQTVIAGRLTLKDGKCPVCDSRVSSLNPLFAIEHIKDEMERTLADTRVHKEAVKRHTSRIDELTVQERQAMKAKSALDAHNVSSVDDIEAMSKRAVALEETISMAEACARGDWQAGAGIDSQARAHCEAIASLEETAGRAGARPVEELESELTAVRHAIDAVTFLEAHSVGGAADIDAMERRAEALGAVAEMAEACARGDWQAGAGIDSQARAHCEAIAALEERVAGAGGRPAGEIRAELEAVRRAIDAATFLEAHSVGGAADIEDMERKAEGLDAVVGMAEACARGDWQAGAGIDSQARAHCEAIAALEETAGRAGGRGVAEITAELKDAKAALDGVNRRHGGAEQRARALADSISKNGRLSAELETVSAYVRRLDSIRDVFRRDGPVATSMRSWALDEIARGSTEHLGLLDTRINRITLSEKDRNVTVTCHAGVTTSGVYSLSGGEQVCVALALRLGMARLLGPSGPRYVILDEPTAHLDEERRKALAHVLTNLSGASEGRAPMQFIMITHDAEIFGEAPVERCYRFEPGERGTVVSELGRGD